MSRTSEIAGRADTQTLEVNVLFTDLESTRMALEAAGSMARDLRAGMLVVVPQVVPYPLPLDKPPVAPGMIRQICRIIAPGAKETVRILVCLCRDRRQMLLRLLRPGSLVVLGGRRCWWMSREKRLARWLRTRGHQVFFVER